MKQSVWKMVALVLIAIAFFYLNFRAMNETYTKGYVRGCRDVVSDMLSGVGVGVDANALSAFCAGKAKDHLGSKVHAQ